MKKIFAVIVAYNHEKTLKQVYERIDKNFFNKVIIFDDCSADNTFEIAKTLGCECYQNEKNLGHGGNLKKSVNFAFKHGADYVLEVHGDNQYDPNDILKAKMFIDNDYDLIIGSRFVNKNPYLNDGMPLLRYLTNKTFSQVTSYLLKINLTEFHTGFKIFSKKFHDLIPYEKNSESYLFSFQVILQSKMLNLKIAEVSISSTYDVNSTSCNHFNGLLYLIGNIKSILMFYLAKTRIYIDPIFKIKDD